jgi:hypothetical protein
MAIIEQIKGSNLSKKGKTNPSGVFEGVPSNVAAVVRGSSVPLSSPAIAPIQDPLDATYDALPQPTYLNYIKAANKR